MVCARQAVCSWGWFDLKPSFAQVIEALENLGTGKKQEWGNFCYFLSNYINKLYFRRKTTYILNVNLHALSA